MTSATGSQTGQSFGSAPPFVFLAPRSPPPFHGDRFEDVEDWLAGFNRVAAFNQWDDERKLLNVYFALQDSAKTWFENHEASFSNWAAFRREVLATFSSSERKENAELALRSRSQQSNESVAMFIEDMTRLFNRADPAMPEATKVRHLMRGVKEQLFAGLMRDPPRTVAAFAKEATTIERSLQERSVQYGRQANVAAAQYCTSLPGPGDEALRALVRSIVREELRHLHLSAPSESVPSTGDVLRDEIRRAVQPPPAPLSEPHVMSYSDALRRPASAPQAFRPVAEQPPPHRYVRPIEQQQDPCPPFRKAYVWRTSNDRPLCYHCGEPGHVLRNCPYRRMGLRGFPPDAPRPRYGERPRDIEEYLNSQVPPPTSQRRQSRSPSPRRFATPSRPSTSGQFGGTSPRREN
ncbi:hypothetical protein V5799_004441 [Amblyomma americanum]|uniref:CCHC-type domain-containing protein n=1 Tax=Amblyomma americanum TaxID=6943 RepID=A0AAQ4D637_AMBAM